MRKTPSKPNTRRASNALSSDQRCSGTHPPQRQSSLIAVDHPHSLSLLPAMTRLFLIWASVIWCVTNAVLRRSEENEVLGQPSVVCTQEGVQFDMETKDPFEGQLYVRDEFRNDNCRANFGGNNRSRRAVTRGSFKLKFSECGMRRQRMVNPDKGMAYSVTMMVQFHPTFVTQNDKAYQVRCFYREQNTKIQSQDISVSPIETEVMNFDYPMPKCSYEIRVGAGDGTPATYVRIGDLVVHSFKCDEVDGTYRMLIKDCFIDDGKNNSQRLLSSNGCSEDETLFQTPQYSGQSLEAVSQSRVFKWPDQSAVYFSCQLSLCMSVDEECRVMTPPDCATPQPKFRKRRSPRAEKNFFLLTTRSPSVSLPVRGAVDFDLEARRLIVLPRDAVIDGAAPKEPTDIPVEAVVFQPAAFTDNESRSSTTSSSTVLEAEGRGIVFPSVTTVDPITSTRKWTSGIGQARPAGHEHSTPEAAEKLADERASASQSGRLCYGPEYAVGFACLLTFFCLLLGAFTLRLCCPMFRDVAEKHCGVTLNWGSEHGARSTSSSSSGDGVYSTISTGTITSVAVDPYVGGIYFGK